MPPNNKFHARTIRESHKIDPVLKANRKKYPRLDDVWEGWKWRLARGPNQGYPLPRTNPQLYLIKGIAFPDLNLPGITILYSYDNDHVDIEAIRIV